MKFNFQKFVKEIHCEFQNEISAEDLSKLLDLGDDYSKDTPVSTGKRLNINSVSFRGVKVTNDEHDYSGQEINFNCSFESGANMLIADNLRGKSSIFKIIKYALTGASSLKPDIKSWIKHVLLKFNISSKEYTIYLNLEKRLHGLLISGTAEFENIKIIDDRIIFEANSEKDYQARIENFFFNQFAYYSLKWTQKSPVKSSDELLEAGASWKTYFKSILLESKDSGTLMYGDQGNKIFQMLLGLQLTYPINRLSIKRDKIVYEKAREESSLKKNNNSNQDRETELIARLKEINKDLEQYSTRGESLANFTKLQDEYSKTLISIQEINRKKLSIEKDLLDANERLLGNKRDVEQVEAELRRIEREKHKTRKNIIDLEEYLEIGIFFSNLDVKHCPSCDHVVTEEKKRSTVKEHKCALCNEDVKGNISDDDQSLYVSKLDRLRVEKEEYQKEENLIRTKLKDLKSQYQSIYERVIILEKRKSEIEETNLLEARLSELSQLIEAEKNKHSNSFASREKLIEEKAVFQYQLKSLGERQQGNTNYDIEIKILEAAIRKLKKQRYEMGNSILTRLAELMLSEINEFGLTSITEIEVNDSFNIKYKQNGEFIAFDEIAEGEQLRAKIAFYLSLIQLDIEYNFGRHPRLLIIDSPGKEEADTKYLEGFSNVLNNIGNRFGDDLQILVGTAERKLANAVPNELIIPEGNYVF
jgi:hypothetical protein